MGKAWSWEKLAVAFNWATEATTTDDFHVAATITETESTTTTKTTADVATTATDAEHVCGISEAANAAYGHLISENVRT